MIDITGKNKVLVVDDEHTNIMALTHILKPDYAVYAAKSGQEALETALDLLPDVILLDVMMPEIDGYAVLAALKGNKKTRDIPVIFITGLRDPGNEERGLHSGAADYIIKPFIPVIVKRRVENQIRIVGQMRQILKKELEEKAAGAKMEILLNMSHDMLTPMNTIIGMTKIAAGSQDPDVIKDCLGEIGIASGELLELIRKLLDIRDA